MAEPAPRREHWGTRLGVIMAVTGSAVGLGNFLRFPGLAAQYEGGAFMIPYFLALIFLGIPIALAEWTMGRFGGACGYNSPPGIFRAIWKSRLAPYIGAFSAMVPVIIYMYYVQIEGWCLGYAWKYATGEMARLAQNNVTGADILVPFAGVETDGGVFSAGWGGAATFVALSFLLNFVLIYRGVAKGIEWFCNIAMPALVVCALIVLVRVLTLPAVEGRTVLDGLGFMWNPTTPNHSLGQALSNANMWIDATGQIFFTLSVGFGLILTYASYVKRNDDIALSSLTSVAGNEFCEVALGGLITIPAAFIFMGAAAVVATQGSGLKLGFFVLPSVFQQMPAGSFFGCVFFFLLFLAAVTSSLSMLQPAIAMLEEGLGLGRKASVALLGFITAIGAGFVGYFSKGLDVLDNFDFWIGSFALYVLAMILVVVFGWVLGTKRAQEELDRGAEVRLPRFLMPLIKYVAPVYLLTVFFAWVYQEADKGEKGKFHALWHDPKTQLSLGFILLVGVLFMMLAAACNRRWQRLGQSAAEDAT